MTKHTKHTHSSYTAKGAGSSCGRVWTAAWEQEVKVEELVKYLRKVQSLSLLTRSDELASARRRYQYLVGVSGSGTLKVEVTDECWRDMISERKQADLTFKNVVRSLQRLRRECWLARVEARARLSPYQYWSHVRRLRNTSKKVRTEEQA